MYLQLIMIYNIIQNISALYQLNWYMEKGKKVYNLVICFDETDDACEYLAEEIYLEDPIPEGTPDILEPSDAPSTMLQDFVDNYYEALFAEFTVIGIA